MFKLPLMSHFNMQTINYYTNKQIINLPIIFTNYQRNIGTLTSDIIISSNQTDKNIVNNLPTNPSTIILYCLIIINYVPNYNFIIFHLQNLKI